MGMAHLVLLGTTFKVPCAWRALYQAIQPAPSAPWAAAVGAAGIQQPVSLRSLQAHPPGSACKALHTSCSMMAYDDSFSASMSDFMKAKQRAKKKRRDNSSTSRHDDTAPGAQSWSSAPTWNERLVFEQLWTQHQGHQQGRRPHHSTKRHGKRQGVNSAGGWRAAASADGSDSDDGSDPGCHQQYEFSNQGGHTSRRRSRRKRRSGAAHRQRWWDEGPAWWGGGSWAHAHADDRQPWEDWVDAYLRTGPYRAGSRADSGSGGGGGGTSRQASDRWWYQKHWEQQAGEGQTAGASWSGYSSNSWWEHYRQGSDRHSQQQQQSRRDTTGGSACVSPDVLAHLRVLGLPATTQLCARQLKAAFHRCAMQWHPDRHASSSSAGGDTVAGRASDYQAAERFKEAKAAYEALRAMC